MLFKSLMRNRPAGFQPTQKYPHNTRNPPRNCQQSRPQLFQDCMTNRIRTAYTGNNFEPLFYVHYSCKKKAKTWFPCLPRTAGGLCLPHQIINNRSRVGHLMRSSRRNPPRCGTSAGHNIVYHHTPLGELLRMLGGLFGVNSKKL